MPFYGNNIAGIIIANLVQHTAGCGTGASAFRIGFFTDNDAVITKRHPGDKEC